MRILIDDWTSDHNSHKCCLVVSGDNVADVRQFYHAPPPRWALRSVAWPAPRPSSTTAGTTNSDCYMSGAEKDNVGLSSRRFARQTFHVEHKETGQIINHLQLIELLLYQTVFISHLITFLYAHLMMTQLDKSDCVIIRFHHTVFGLLNRRFQSRHLLCLHTLTVLRQCKTTLFQCRRVCV